MITESDNETNLAAPPLPNTRIIQINHIRRMHGLSETAARLIAALHFGEVA